jgi:ribosomal protein L40E
MSRDEAQSSDEVAEADADEGRELDQQITQYLKIGLPVVTLVGATVAGVILGAAGVLLVLAAGALVSVIAIFWASIRTLVGETPLSGADAYALGAPRAAEEQKRAVLRALKDIEFERSIGKISEDDYQALVTRYRAEAKRLLRLLDEDGKPGRQKVEALVLERLVHAVLAADAAPAPAERNNKKKKGGKPAPAPKPAAASPRSEDAAPEERANEAEAGALPVCASCGTRNDADAVFCKKCGARQHAGAEEEEESAEVKKKAGQEGAS